MMGSDGEVRWNCVPLHVVVGTAYYVSHTCAFWIMVSPYTHLMGSCDTHRQEVCRRTECAGTALIASNVPAVGI